MYNQGTVSISNFFEFSVQEFLGLSLSQHNHNCSFLNYENVSHWWRLTPENYAITDLWIEICKITIRNIFTIMVGNNILNMKQIELNFCTKLSICDLQFRLQYRCMPKNLTYSVILRNWLLYAMCSG